ncbi:MAG TPA: hypothetical protein DCG16_05870 [Gemmatimonadetes bacterium]|nr:hypothetical protein [Gemmatimonadota bacterium]
MLPGSGGYPGCLGAIPIPAERHGDVPVIGNLRVVHPWEHPGGFNLLVPYDVGHVLNGRAGHGVIL